MTALHGVAVAVAAVGCVIDLRTRRIPNALTFSAAAAALAYRAAAGGVDALAAGAAGWLIGALVFFLPFLLGGLGGGDVKLLAALGAWVGPADVLWLALYSGAAGGVLAFATALVHGYARQAFRNVWLLLCHWRVAGLRAVPELTLEGSAAPKLAYALPILCGTVVTSWLR
jgi:prepilin peptidase CpaA